MSDKETEQALLPLHEKPAFHSSEVEPALKSLKNLVAKLAKKPAPKKEKPAKVDNSTTTEEAEADTAAAGGEGREGENDAASPGEGEANEGGEGGGDRESEVAAGEAGAEEVGDPLREEEL